MSRATSSSKLEAPVAPTVTASPEPETGQKNKKDKKKDEQDG